MRGKKYLAQKKSVDPKKVYTIEEAIAILKSGGRKFDETVEIHTKLGIDPTKGEQLIRLTFTMPIPFGKSKRLAAFVGEADEAKAKTAGADLVGGEELINEIAKTEKIDFDVAVATPSMMPKLAKIAKILGPKGLMPNPKTETVGPDVAKMIGELKKGKHTFKNDDTGNLHVAIGKLGMAPADLAGNIRAFLEVLARAKPQTSKGIFLKNIFLTSTMGPSIKIIV
ncbi:MAG: LSU ribosomal protein L1p (L10Ae) [Candidatus Magasanikbacteria bacterium]|nr:LSU ribosomal protein L1p (L10Ae) [Candidatus Magasanikbacteria bacterium]